MTVAAGTRGRVRGRARALVGALAYTLTYTPACASTGASTGAPPRGARPDPDREEWVQLFNGRDLAGWTAKVAKHPAGENYARTFRVRDGVLEARYDAYGGDYAAQFAHLYYRRPYSHYLLAFEYRLVGALYPGAPSYTLRNSGVMIHAQDPRTMPPAQNFPISVEMQLLGGLGDGTPRPTGNMCSPGTAVVFGGKLDPRHCITSTSRTYDGERWVRAAVLVLGDSVVKHIVEGDTVLTYTRPHMAAGVVAGFDPARLRPGEPLASGFIALQAEGQPVDFRDVRLLDLAGCTDPRALTYKRYVVRSEPSACRFER